MLRDDEKPPPLPPCAVCAQPAPFVFWESQLCEKHTAQWHAEAPALEPLELTHADAHPEDVEERGVHKWVDQKPWVILRRGVTERVARDAARAWVRQARTLRIAAVGP